MALKKIILISISFIAVVVDFVVSNNFEGFIVEGRRAKIEDFPHSVFLYIECYIGYTTTYACSASIINQVILLTAAHCLIQCQVDSTFLVAYVGDCVAGGGSAYPNDNYKLHEKYDEDEISNDIALVKLNGEIKFEINVRRVSLMRDSPYEKYAKVAGWGYTDVSIKQNKIYFHYLHYHHLHYISRSPPAGHRPPPRFAKQTSHCHLMVAILRTMSVSLVLAGISSFLM